VNPKKRKRWKARPACTRQHIIELDGGLRVIVEYGWKAGNMSDFAVVLIYVHENGTTSDQICRYDTAHGYAHLDVLDTHRNVIKKVALPSNLSYKEALNYAINDLKANCKKYSRNFREGKGGA
jgi:hypothetical protein